MEERVGNYTGARKFYSASLLIEPSAPALVACAMLKLRHPETKPANLSEVKGLFEEALLLDPRHGSAYNAFGNMELRRGNVNEARRIFNVGVHAHHCRNTGSVYHGLAMLELSLGNVDVAREVLIKGIKEVETREQGMDSAQHQRSAFLDHTLGMLELNSNRAAAAMQTFLTGIEKHGNSSQLLLGAALCEVKLGRDDSARTWFERAVKADEKHAQAWQVWGLMELRAGNFQKAQALFDSGIRSNPNHGALWHALATMIVRTGNLATARTTFSAGVKRCPRHVGLYQGWASLELRDGNYLIAKRLIGEALTRDKTLGPGWLVAAEIEENLGNDGLVSLILRRGIECCTNDAELYYTLGQFYVKRGKIADVSFPLKFSTLRGPSMTPLSMPLLLFSLLIDTGSPNI